ncbi:MAG TPA: hypothetical protein VFB74_30610 [Kribbellaceae bacterium]|nr:hypothetical protein [Kribbellaceae bacterium]
MTELNAAPTKHLVLHIEVPGFYADDLHEMAGYCSEPDEPTAEDYLFVVTEEWMRRDVGLTLVSLPGEKSTNDDFEVHAYTGRIVGAEIKDPS